MSLLCCLLNTEFDIHYKKFPLPPQPEPNMNITLNLKGFVNRLEVLTDDNDVMYLLPTPPEERR